MQLGQILTQLRDQSFEVRYPCLRRVRAKPRLAQLPIESPGCHPGLVFGQPDIARYSLTAFTQYRVRFIETVQFKQRLAKTQIPPGIVGEPVAQGLPSSHGFGPIPPAGCHPGVVLCYPDIARHPLTAFIQYRVRFIETVQFKQRLAETQHRGNTVWRTLKNRAPDAQSLVPIASLHGIASFVNQRFSERGGLVRRGQEAFSSIIVRCEDRRQRLHLYRGAMMQKCSEFS